MWKQLPIWLALGLLTVQAFAELAAMWRTGSLKRKRSPEWTFHAVNVPYRLMFAAGVIERYYFPHEVPVWQLWLGATLLVLGIAIRVMSHLYLGYYFSPFVELADEHQLQQTGFYRYVRHPMYLGTFLIIAGTPVLTASWWSTVFAIAATLGLVARLRKEERFLHHHFPEYDQYAKRTWTVMPGVW